MPKERGIYSNLPKLLTRQTMDHILLGYVLGYRHISPIGILQVRAAIQKFIEDFRITEDECGFDTVIQNFYRIYDDLNEFTTDEDRRRWKKIQRNNGTNKSNKGRKESGICD